MAVSVAETEAGQNKEEMALELFQRLGWSFCLSSIKGIMIPQNLEEILLAVDYEYFFKIEFPELRLALMVPVIRKYMAAVLLCSFNAKVEKELLAENARTWVALVIYLFGNCPMKGIFIQEIMECSPQAQEYYMVLMGEVAENIRAEDGSGTKLSGVDELENELREKTQELLEARGEVQKLKQENASLKGENAKLTKALSDFCMERAEQLDSVNASNMEELLDFYREALEVNDKLSAQLERFEDENSQLQEMYSGLSNDLVIAKHENEEKENVLRTRVSTVRRRSTLRGMRFATNSDSDEEISYRDSIEMHTKPLKEEIGHLDRYSRNLRYQMRMLYKEFTKFTTDLKPFKDDGMFQEVPRSVF